MKELLSIISIVGFIAISVLCLLAAKFGNEWATKMMDTILPMVIQCWIINFTALFQFHFGTSAGSQRKTDIMSRMMTPKKDDCVELTDELK